MRILVIGGTGTIGKAVVAALEREHEVITAAHSSGDFQVDISAPGSLRDLFERVGTVDAIVSCSGNAAWKPLAELTDEDFAFSLGNKLMGQVNVVRYGLKHVRPGGSITLTSGVLSQEPSPGSVAVSLVNAALEGFARAAALDVPQGIRVNVVSPPWVSETLQQMGQDPAGGLPAATVAKAYVSSVRGQQNGAIIDARAFG